MSKIQLGNKMSHFSTLNINHLLFKRLKSENPSWWQFVICNIKTGGFYVDIRKDNSLNVYYNGGSLLKISLSKGRIKGEIHEYYIGHVGSKYVEYELEQLTEDIDSIKSRITSRFSNTSENGIKARLITDLDSTYIDSEFAYPEIIGMNDKGANIYKTTRIDLTKLENDKIIFVELKRIEDGRLLTNKYDRRSPEILSQMKDYQQFITNHRQDIIEYYKTLFEIKHSLGILPIKLSNLTDISTYELSEDVELYIEPYSELNTKRKRRVEAIKDILYKNNIIHNL